MSFWSDLGIQQWRQRAPLGVVSEQVNSSESELVVSDSSLGIENFSAAQNIQLAEDPSSFVDQEAMHDATLDSTVVSEPMVQAVHEPQRPELSWNQLVSAVQDPKTCSNCAPVSAVLGDGDIQASWVFVIDSPSQQDIQAQQLLSGRAGQLFDAILAAAQLSRASIYLTSIFKCPPNADYKISPQCGYLVHQQIELIKPKMIFCLGEFSAQALLRSNEELAKLRQIPQGYSNSNIPLLPSYSISELLDKPSRKSALWNDLKKAMSLAPINP